MPLLLFFVTVLFDLLVDSARALGELALAVERADALDAHLWTYRDDSFLPHATWRAADAAEQPILLVLEESNPNDAQVRFLVDNAGLPAETTGYERMVLVFNGDDDEALAAARSAWTECKARGLTATYWQADERGRWQKRN